MIGKLLSWLCNSGTNIDYDIFWWQFNGVNQIAKISLRENLDYVRDRNSMNGRLCHTLPLGETYFSLQSQKWSIYELNTNINYLTIPKIMRWGKELWLLGLFHICFDGIVAKILWWSLLHKVIWPKCLLVYFPGLSNED